jgi:hypothetical protein
MTGVKEHVTSKHIQGRDRADDTPPEQSTTPPVEPVVAALDIPSEVPYEGGGLHLHGGLFVAQLSEVPDLSRSNDVSPPNDSTLCRDDFFHVTPGVQDQPESYESTPPPDFGARPNGSIHLLTEDSSSHQPSSHGTFGIYMLSLSSTSTISIHTEMNSFLTRVVKRCDLKSTNRESWINAVTRKLSDIGILSVPVFPSEIRTINDKL